MSEEEVNQYIHTQILGRCWHALERFRSGFGNLCPKCNARYELDYTNPKYGSGSV